MFKYILCHVSFLFHFLSKEILSVFENIQEEERVPDDEDGKSYRRLGHPSPWMESEFL